MTIRLGAFRSFLSAVSALGLYPARAGSLPSFWSMKLVIVRVRGRSRLLGQLLLQDPNVQRAHLLDRV